MGKRGKSKYMGKFKPGHVFGSWTVVDGKPYGSPAKLEVSCVCKTRRNVDVYTLVKGKSTSCGCNRVGENAPNWKGVNGLSKTAINKNIAYTSTSGGSITANDMANLYCVQSGTCGVTGQTLTTTTARLERIDPSQPYSSDNAVWIHNSVSPIVANYGVQGAVNIANSVVTTTSQPNNIFEKLGFTSSDGKSS